MKIVIKADKARFEKYMPAGKTDEYDISFFNLEISSFASLLFLAASPNQPLFSLTMDSWSIWR